MRIHSTKRRIWEVGTLAIGLILSLILIKILPYFLVARTPYEIAILIHFLCGVFVVSAVGMILEEESRIGGLLLAAISIPLLYHLSFEGHIIIEGLLAGIVVGCLLDLYVILKNRFDVLAGTSRTFLTGFFIIFIVYLSYGVLMQLPSVSAMDVYKFIILFALLISLYILLLKTLRGIKAGDVFVFGPKSSGKTYFLLALYDQVVNFFAGRHKEVIISPDEEELRIENMLAKVEEGEVVRGTHPDEVAMYALSGKRMGISPVELTVIDYGGEQISKINLRRYREVIADLSKRIDENEVVVKSRIGSMEFLEWLKENHSPKFEDIADSVVSAYLYKRLESAGKIIFLVDGELIANFHKRGRGELMRLFGHYGRIMDMFGSDRKYALVVTKTDMFKELPEVAEGSKEAEEIEKDIYRMLWQLGTFKELEHRASRVQMHFYAVSVDATKKPLPSDNKEEEGRGPRQIYPWRVGEVAKFGF